MTPRIAMPRDNAVNDAGGGTRDECAERYGISRQAVEQAEHRAVRWLWRYGLRRTLCEDPRCHCGTCQRVRSVLSARATDLAQHRASLGGCP